MPAPANIAVLTGDLVGSSGIPEGDLNIIFRALRATTRDIGAWQNAPVKLARSRGDGWQVCLSRPEFALRSALLFRASVRYFGKTRDTRVAIAVGDGKIGISGDLNAATGPAFIQSGRALDALKGDPLMVHTAGGALGAATRLADHISKDWTEIQATTIYDFLSRKKTTRAEAAERLGKSRQSVDQALAAAGFRAIEEALAMIEREDP